MWTLLQRPFRAVSETLTAAGDIHRGNASSWSVSLLPWSVSLLPWSVSSLTTF
ncbi:MAG: hypothetical protein AVDCRST_MAG56-1145 [uncultured Cytophagales bacterium]|uniref:Uncharacterized protein n=1 Tax=uncultured Cytophagales bacterium TaxID=158755 RepID=A0A6J4HS45_9SPHI|nr:MAG: hypothetical protein AVDCRST_MAG56-1145 [uncultured Cytophagales bacterium]